jgi:hypothetical protein
VDKSSQLVRGGGRFVVEDTEGVPWCLDSEDFLRLLTNDIISIPSVSKIELEEKSKGNGIAKAIASIQILYFGMQLLGRAIQQRAISLLEVFTLAMILMALVIYFFWWSKPMDVRLPIIIAIDRSDEGSQRAMEGYSKSQNSLSPGRYRSRSIMGEWSLYNWVYALCSCGVWRVPSSWLELQISHLDRKSLVADCKCELCRATCPFRVNGLFLKPTLKYSYRLVDCSFLPPTLCRRSALSHHRGFY